MVQNPNCNQILYYPERRSWLKYPKNTMIFKIANCNFPKYQGCKKSETAMWFPKLYLESSREEKFVPDTVGRMTAVPSVKAGGETIGNSRIEATKRARKVHVTVNSEGSGWGQFTKGKEAITTQGKSSRV